MSENLKLLGAYSDAMFAGDDEAVFRFWAPEFVSHVTDRINPDAVGTDIRGFEVDWWRQVRAAFPDYTFDVDLLIEHDDLVVSNWTVRGTHTGAAFYGVEPSGRAVVINGTAILRLRDGKLVEHWGGPHCQEGLGLTHPPEAVPRAVAHRLPSPATPDAG
jgi:predicted ester cyclase